MSAMASQIATLMIVYSTVYSGANQRRHQRSALQAFVMGIHQWLVNSPHKGPVTQKMFPFDDVIMGFHISVVVSKLLNILSTSWSQWPTEVEDCSLPPPNMAATKTGEQGKAWFSVL